MPRTAPLIRRHAGMALLVALIGLAASAPSALAEPVRWDTRLGFPQTLPVMGQAAESLRRRLAGPGDGGLDLVLQPSPDGAAAAGIPAAVAEGDVAAGFTRLGRGRGRIGAIHLFDAAPFGLGPTMFMAWYYEGKGHDLLQEVLANQGMDVHAVLCGVAGAESAGWFAGPVNDVADFRDMTGRFGGLGGEVLKRLGMKVSDIPATGIAKAVESGTLQATEMATPAIDVHTGIHETLPYNLHPGWQQPSTPLYLLVNGNRWRSLAPANQARVRTACEAVTARTLARATASRGEALSALRAKGAKVQRLPGAVLTALREAADTVLGAHAERNPQFRRVLESQRAFAEARSPLTR